MRQFTFHRIVPRPGTYQHWATVRFAPNGDVLYLGRDKVRSTRRAWHAIGKYSLSESGNVVSFDSGHDTEMVRIVATGLALAGWAVYGATQMGWEVDNYSPERDGYKPTLTTPKSIRRAMGLSTEAPRCRSLDLGQHAKGTEVARVETTATLANMADAGNARYMAKKAWAAHVRK